MPFTVKDDNSNFVITDAAEKYDDPNKERRDASFHKTQVITTQTSDDAQMASGQGGRYPMKNEDGAYYANMQVADDTSYDDLKNGHIEAINNITEQTNNEVAGSTFVHGFYHDNQLYISNLGDSAAFLIEQDNNGEFLCTPLTRKHTPADPIEAQKVIDNGGFVIINRVHGRLAVSRALGDNGITGVLREQEITEVTLSQEGTKQQFILLCSDGLTDQLSREQMLAVFAANEENPENIAEALVEESQHYSASNNGPSRHDNTTTMVIPITPEKSCTFGLADGHGHDDVYANPVSNVAVTEMTNQLDIILKEKVQIVSEIFIEPTYGVAPRKSVPPIEPNISGTGNNNSDSHVHKEDPSEEIKNEDNAQDNENPLIELLGDKNTLSKEDINNAFSGKGYNSLQKAEYLEDAFSKIKEGSITLYQNDDRNFLQKRSSRYDAIGYSNLQFKHIGILKDALIDLARFNNNDNGLKDYIFSEECELAGFRRGHSVSKKQFDNGESKTLTQLKKIFKSPDDTNGCSIKPW